MIAVTLLATRAWWKWLVPLALGITCPMSLAARGWAQSNATPAPSLTAQRANREASPTAIAVLNVDPVTGSDATGTGSDTAPLKTITKALRIARPNTIIQLAPGIYSAQTGESFPLQLKPVVTVRGEPSDRGDSVLIWGGGSFNSPTAGRQNATAIAADRAGLTGVSLTNPSDRGCGLWIETGTPVVVGNLFKGSLGDGIAIAGNSTPVIQGNRIEQNQGSGIVLFATSRARIRDNVIIRNRYGLHVRQEAAPAIAGNAIAGNQWGVWAEDSARPVLRNNSVENNWEGGVAAVNRAVPDLGTLDAPGGNIVRNNGEIDLRNDVTTAAMPAVGNQLEARRLRGRIDVNAATDAENALVLPASSLPPLASLADATIASAPKATVSIEPDTPEPASVEPTSEPTSFVPAATERATEQVTTRSPRRSLRRTIEPTPPPATSTNRLRLPTGNNALRLPTGNNAIDIPVPPPETQASPPLPVLAPPPESTNTSSDRFNRPGNNSPASSPLTDVVEVEPVLGTIPVPDAIAPLGNFDRQPTSQGTIITAPPTGGDEPPPPPLLSEALGLRYRVLVNADNEGDRTKVRAVAADAFPLPRDRSLMQAGAFRDRAAAEEVLEQLTRQGLRAWIESID